MSQDTGWITVCALSDILPWTGVAARIEGEQVAVFRVAEDELFVLANHDPFSGANVMSRGIIGDIGGELVVAAPVYKQHFRLRDGQCIEDDGVQLKTWPVRVYDGMVLVSAAAKSVAA